MDPFPCLSICISSIVVILDYCDNKMEFPVGKGRKRKVTWKKILVRKAPKKEDTPVASAEVTEKLPNTQDLDTKVPDPQPALVETEDPNHKAPQTLVAVKSELGNSEMDQLLAMLIHMGYGHHESEEAITWRILNQSGPSEKNIDINDVIQDIHDARAKCPVTPPLEPPSKDWGSWQSGGDADYWGLNDTDQNWQPNSWDTYGWSNNWKSWWHGWEYDQHVYQRSWSNATGDTATSHQIQDAMERADTFELEERPCGPPDYKDCAMSCHRVRFWYHHTSPLLGWIISTQLTATHL